MILFAKVHIPPNHLQFSIEKEKQKTIIHMIAARQNI